MFLLYIFMKTEDKLALESTLEKRGYRKIESCKITLDDDYEWYKAVYNPEVVDEQQLKYQIFFEFWDWTKYGGHDNGAWGVSITISPESCHDNVGRRDLKLSVDWERDVERVERVAEDFYEFITKRD